MVKLIRKYAPEFTLVVVCITLFLFTIIVNPQTLMWVGLAQLKCDLPAHSKCVARGLIFDANLPSRNIDVYRTR